MKKLLLLMVLAFTAFTFARAQSSVYWSTGYYDKTAQLGISAGCQAGVSTTIHNGVKYHYNPYTVYKVWIGGNEAKVNFQYPSLFTQGDAIINGTTMHREINGIARAPFSYEGHINGYEVNVRGYVRVDFRASSGTMNGSITLEDVIFETIY